MDMKVDLMRRPVKRIISVVDMHLLAVRSFGPGDIVRVFH